MISITKVQREDVPTLSRIGSLSLIESHGKSAPAHVMQSYVDENFSETALREEVIDPANIFYLVSYNGEPVGYSKIVYNISIESVSHPNITKMERLYVLAKFHNFQLGRQLMDFNIKLSKHHDQQGMWLYVWKENHRAIRFYERTGFTIVGDGYFRLTADHANPNWQMFMQF
ncbi:MAG TPA: GNAT family N-acetyltransferase [Segetibacter sp.]|jgi:ribosomal protein S18 acetylase RimI-like enzyme